MPSATLPTAAPSASAQAPAPPAGGRQTKPTWYNPYSSASFGSIARRTQDEFTARFALDCFLADPKHVDLVLANYAAIMPLRLLWLLLEKHPILSAALEIDLALAFSPGDTKIVAIKPGEKDDRGRSVQDDAGTAEIADLFERCGGLGSLQRAIGKYLTGIGQAIVEAVPGPRGQGVSDIFTADPLRTRFRAGKAEQGESPLVLQGEDWTTAGQWKDLSSETVFSVTVDATRDNPYGIARYSAALDPAIANMRVDADLLEVLHAFVLPRLTVGFPLKEMIEYAKENTEILAGAGVDGSDLTPSQWAQGQLDNFKQFALGLHTSDVLVGITGSSWDVISGGGGLTSGVNDVLDRLRHNVIMGTNVPSALFGITYGGTQAYSKEQSSQHVTMAQFLRSVVNGVLVKVSNLHFRLRGLNLTARADVTAIRTMDAKTEQETEKLLFENVANKIRAGFLTIEEGCMIMTDSGIADMEKAKAYFSAVIAPAAAETNPPADSTTDDGGDTVPID